LGTQVRHEKISQSHQLRGAPCFVPYGFTYTVAAGVGGEGGDGGPCLIQRAYELTGKGGAEREKCHHDSSLGQRHWMRQHTDDQTHTFSSEKGITLKPRRIVVITDRCETQREHRTKRGKDAARGSTDRVGGTVAPLTGSVFRSQAKS